MGFPGEVQGKVIGMVIALRTFLGGRGGFLRLRGAGAASRVRRQVERALTYSLYPATPSGSRTTFTY